VRHIAPERGTRAERPLLRPWNLPPAQFRREPQPSVRGAKRPAGSSVQLLDVKLLKIRFSLVSVNDHPV